MLKDIGLGAMSIFISLLGVLATARLLPQDLEDRTIYTILSKPVPRFDYLFGKLAGVLVLLTLSLAIMGALFLVVLAFREQTVLRETARRMSSVPPDQIAKGLREIRESVFNANLCAGIAIIFVKGVVLSSLTLFVSTIASNQIFTTVVMTLAYFIGHLQSIAREYWLAGSSPTWLTSMFLGFVTLFFPDLQNFNLVDDIAAGTAIPMQLVIKTGSLGFSYSCFYLLLASAVFSCKEI